jgi:choline kinase
MKHGASDSKRVTTALLLAAGIGSRLYPLTEKAPKCLTVINGRSILERLVSSLNGHGFNRLVVVTGYMEKHIREFLGSQAGNLTIEYVFCPLYDTTNNIFSLWMARDAINEPFLLLESDLVFDYSLIGTMLYPDRIAIATKQPWMNGTCVTIDKHKRVKAFLGGDAEPGDEITYKTVNMYSLSLASWRRIIRRLDKHISAGKVQNYYEVVFAEMIADGTLSCDSVSFDGKPWLEIDTTEDLARARQLWSGRPTITATDPLLPLGTWIIGLTDNEISQQRSS